ncbi:protein HAIKU1-like [Trifolium pratense]|uniref:protein HAIKU1-like n=1 Tax=Trifolium pratense TaxID=57577 RepID=UPI001E6960E2|nr:protein HAIKU1-like [Trifolium pratense]
MTNLNFGINKSGKNIKKSRLQQIIDFRNNVITSGRNRYPQDKVHNIHKDDFKSFVQDHTGKQSNGSKSLAENEITRLQKIRPPPLSITRPQIPIQVPVSVQIITSPPAPYNVLSSNGPPLVDHSWTNIVESPISAFVRNFLNSPQKQIMNNANVQYQPDHFPFKTQVVTNVQHTQSTSSLVPNPLMHLNATNQNFTMNGGNQFVNDFPESPTLEFLLSSPTSNESLLFVTPELIILM